MIVYCSIIEAKLSHSMCKTLRAFGYDKYIVKIYKRQAHSVPSRVSLEGFVFQTVPC